MECSIGKKRKSEEYADSGESATDSDSNTGAFKHSGNTAAIDIAANNRVTVVLFGNETILSFLNALAESIMDSMNRAGDINATDLKTLLQVLTDIYAAIITSFKKSKYIAINPPHNEGYWSDLGGEISIITKATGYHVEAFNALDDNNPIFSMQISHNPKKGVINIYIEVNAANDEYNQLCHALAYEMEAYIGGFCAYVKALNPNLVAKISVTLATKVA